MENQTEQIVYEPLMPYSREYRQSAPIIYKVLETYDPKGKKIRFVLKFYEASGWDNLVRVHPDDTHEAPDYCKRWDKFLDDYPEFEGCSPVGVFLQHGEPIKKGLLIHCQVEDEIERFKIHRIGTKYVHLRSDEYSGDGCWHILKEDLALDPIKHPYPLAKQYC